MKKSVLLISMFLSSMQINSQEQSKISVYPHSYWENVLLRFNRLRAMDYLTEKATPLWKLFTPHKTNDSVEPEYHRYAQEAKRFFEIPESRNIQLEKASFNFYYRACTAGNNIYLNTDYIKDDILPQKKLTVLHEMAHVKNNDNVSVPLIPAIGMPSITPVFSLLRKLFPMQNNTLYDVTETLAPLLVLAATYKYHKYIERRADKQALYGLQCHKCIDAVEPVYISMREKQAILEDVKKHQQVCSYHKSSLHALYYNSKNLLERLSKS